MHCNSTLRIAAMLCGTVLVMLARMAHGADMPSSRSLEIGDPAPQLQVMKWLSGPPVEYFVRNHIYVVEFWATWCGPCIEEMPHLSDLAKKYADKASIIAVSVRESEGSKTADSKSVQRFLDRHRQKMAHLLVAMDDPATNSVLNSWLTAADVNLIPATFIIDRDGTIAWIGHPRDLDQAIPAVVDGTFDRAAARRKHEADIKDQALVKAFKRKDWVGVLEEARRRTQEDPQYENEPQNFWLIFSARLHVNGSEALAYAERKAEDADFLRAMSYAGALAGENFLNSVAGTIARQEGFSVDAYQFAKNRVEAVLKRSSESYYWWGVMAQARFNLQHFKGALAAQQKAVELMGGEAGSEAFEQIRTTMKERLVSYKEKVEADIEDANF